MKIISAPYAIQSSRSMNPAQSLSTTDDVVQPVFGARATERDARFFQTDVIAHQSNLKTTSNSTYQILKIAPNGAPATKSSAAVKAYRQAEMLTLQHIETKSIIL